MNEREFRDISEDIRVPSVVMEGYLSAIEQIKEQVREEEGMLQEGDFADAAEYSSEEVRSEEYSSEEDAEGSRAAKRKAYRKLQGNSGQKTRKNRKRYGSPAVKAAAILFALFLASGITVVSVKAYITHIARLENMSSEEIIEKYETVFGKDSHRFSRAMTEAEEHRIFEELLQMYCDDLVEPAGQVGIIETKDEYTGEGIAFSLEDGILYLPERELTEEEMLEYVEFWMQERYVDYEAYVKASNPNYYKKRLEAMTTQEIEELYVLDRRANTETMFETRDWNEEEWELRKILKNQYRYEGRMPERQLTIIENPEEYTGGVAFCSYNCTIYLPQDTMTEEEILEIEDFKTRLEYSCNKIFEEMAQGIRESEPQVDFVQRDKVTTLDFSTLAEEDVVNLPWIQAYKRMLEARWAEDQRLMEGYGLTYDRTQGYFAIRFIYLNDDEIPELVYSENDIGMQGYNFSNLRNYLYTYKDGEAVLLTPSENIIGNWYNTDKGFSYAERTGLVACYYYYPYDLSEWDAEKDYKDLIRDSMTRVDHWNLESMTRTSTDATMELHHAVSGYEQDYSDAKRWDEYYINVTEITRDEMSNHPGSHKIYGEKTDKKTYEAAEKELWQGAQVTTLTEEDYDIFYAENDTAQALAKAYMKVSE